MGNPIRIPRTTARFITGLASILRDELGLVITEHEHWTFDHRAKREECSSPGICGMHGVSEENMAKIYREHGPGPWRDYDHSCVMPCQPYVLDVYLGVGGAQVRGEKVKLRARIECTYWAGIGRQDYDVQLWVRSAAGTITSGRYEFSDNGRPYPSPGAAEALPPRRIAFWRDSALEDASAP